MASPATLEELAVESLKGMYDAEHKFLEALQEMEQLASDPNLKQVLQMHRTQTQGQIRRLEQVFQQMGQQPQRKECLGVAGIVQEFRQYVKGIQDPHVRDAAIIEAAQKGEHYEIAAYGTARTWAQELGRQDAARIFDEILKEEEETDRKLTQIATSRVNLEALPQQRAA